MKPVILIILALTGVALLGGGLVARHYLIVEPERARARYASAASAERARESADTATALERLGALRTAFRAGAAPATCPSLEKRGERAALVIDVPLLDAWLDGGDLSTLADYRKDSWTTLRSRQLAPFQRSEGLAQAHRRLDAGGVLVLFAAKTVTLPRVGHAAGPYGLPENTLPGAFSGGQWVGNMLVFEYSSSKPLCMVPLEAASSHEAKTVKGAEAQGLLGDLKENLRKAATAKAAVLGVGRLEFSVL